MAKALVRALENGMYVGSIVDVKASVVIDGIKFKVVDTPMGKEVYDSEGVKLDETTELYTLATSAQPEMYTITIQLPDRQITTNKFCNKIIWTDKNGDGWTSMDFFTSGLQRQLDLYEETDDFVILGKSQNVKFYITQYVNPKTNARSYNVDTTQPKGWEVEHDLGVQF